MAELSPLRRRMIEDMTVRNLSPATQLQRDPPRAPTPASSSRFDDRSDRGGPIGKCFNGLEDRNLEIGHGFSAGGNRGSRSGQHDAIRRSTLEAGCAPTFDQGQPADRQRRRFR